MPKFVIEREIAGAGKLPTKELQAISQKSCSVLNSMWRRFDVRGSTENGPVARPLAHSLHHFDGWLQSGGLPIPRDQSFR